MCSCQEANYTIGQWISTKCPFAIGDLETYRRKGVEVFVSIYCECGKEVGELCFAGNKHLGMWKLNRSVPNDKVLINAQHWLSNIYGTETNEI